MTVLRWNKTWPGEERAWELLEQRVPESVCRRAGVAWDSAAGAYVLRLFCHDVMVRPGRREIACLSKAGGALLERLQEHARLSILWYLVSARDLPPLGRLVRPDDLPGGEIYRQGTHVLPLHHLAARYGEAPAALLECGSALGGEPDQYGDASVRLWPLPRVPAVVVLWAADGEFPARASLLFDATCRFQLPVDIVWSTAVMTLLALLEEDRRPGS